jgi:uncharacterized membrane protein YcaP (DUF421 family)
VFILDWESLFIPSTSILEVIFRGTVMYLALFIMLRVILKRETGEVGITDVLVIVLIADAAQNGMAGNYTSITEGLVLVGTLIFWSYVLEWLDFRFPGMSALISPKPLVLVEDGQMMRRNMRRELITKDELMAELRAAGIEDLSLVKRVYLESNGRFSVIRKDLKEPEKKADQTRQK